MEIILLVESMSEARTFEVTNNYGGKETKQVVTVVGNTASGRISCDAFGDQAEHLEKEQVGPGSVLVAEVGFRANEFTTQTGGKFWRTDLRLNNFITTCKQADAAADPEIY